MPFLYLHFLNGLSRYMKKYIYLLCYMMLLQSCAAQSTPNLIDGELETVTSEKLSYYLYYPDDYELEADKEFPILLFLHGGGESGDSLVSIKRSGPPKMIVDGKQFPFLILAPQNPYQKKWWNTRAVNQLLDSIVLSNRIDKKRIYLTGLSRGGGAAWDCRKSGPVGV